MGFNKDTIIITCIKIIIIIFKNIIIKNLDTDTPFSSQTTHGVSGFSDNLCEWLTWRNNGDRNIRNHVTPPHVVTQTRYSDVLYLGD